MMFSSSLIRLTFSRSALVSFLLTSVAGVSLSWAAIVDGGTTSSTPSLNPQATSLVPIDPEQVDFQADSVIYDEANQLITAEGQVEVAQDGRLVKAQKIVYDLPKDSVEAVGDVALMDKNGDVHFAERVQLQNKLKDGYIKKLRSVLADGSRITAEEGQKQGERTVMKNASYTPCEECKSHPEKAPLWQIVADEVTHDNAAHSIAYKNAKFEVHGVPVAYTPYFSHSDGTIKQKSGFLTPKLSYSSRQGFGLASKYYWAINPSEDATIGARVFSKNNPQLLGEYRKRYDAAEIKFDSSMTYSDDDNENEIRGHLFSNGLWDIDSKWRAGYQAQLTSDDNYLREFNLSRDNVLENQIYVERFDDRDYLVARALAFQDLRVSNRSADQPNILPEVQASFMGDPNALLGGHWTLNLSSLNLLRKGNGQDVFRTSLEAGWERKDTLSLGLVNTFTISSRADSYQISDRDETSSLGGAGDANAYRVYPVINDTLSYPLVKNVGAAQVMIEPTVALTAAPKIKNNTDIPNEDSQDVQIDSANIFEANRFPGIDRVEDGTHVTAGARTGYYDADGSKGEIFLGQSYRLDDMRNPFPDGSGLSNRESDVVGQVIAQYKDLYNLNYRFELGSENLESVRHELDGYADFGDLSLSLTYLYARRLESAGLDDSRQQVYASTAYAFDEEWNLLTAARYDLSEQEKGLRYAQVGLNYIGQCFNVLTTIRRSYADEETADNATEFSVQLGLKNLGSFGTDQ